MTLGELAEYICAKVGQTDEESVAVCQLFLRRRYQMIWDSALWKESLFTHTVTTSTGTCVLPSTCDQIAAVRIGNRALQQLDQTLLMRCDPGAYTRTSASPSGFIYLSPTCLSVAIAGTMPIYMASTSEVDTDVHVHLVGELVSGQEVRESVPLTGTTVASSSFGYANLLSAGLSGVCVGDVGIGGQVIAAGSLSLEQRPRVRLVEWNGSSTAVTFLCKRRFHDLLVKSDAPLLRNCENALLAFGCGDMLERQRQYAKAQLKMREGEAQMQLLLELERSQSAFEQRIVPVEIGGQSAEGGSW